MAGRGARYYHWHCRRLRGGEVVRMETERTRRIVELINKLNSEQMDRLERFLRELLGLKEEGKGR